METLYHTLQEGILNSKSSIIQDIEGYILSQNFANPSRHTWDPKTGALKLWYEHANQSITWRLRIDPTDQGIRQIHVVGLDFIHLYIAGSLNCKHPLQIIAPGAQVIFVDDDNQYQNVSVKCADITIQDSALSRGSKIQIQCESLSIIEDNIETALDGNVFSGSCKRVSLLKASDKYLQKKLNLSGSYVSQIDEWICEYIEPKRKNKNWDYSVAISKDELNEFMPGLMKFIDSVDILNKSKNPDCKTCQFVEITGKGKAKTEYNLTIRRTGSTLASSLKSTHDWNAERALSIRIPK